MPADRLRRLRGPERPAATLPALSPLPPCCGPPEAILRGLRGCALAAAPLWAPCCPAVGHAAPCCPVAACCCPVACCCCPVAAWPPCGPCPGLPPLPWPAAPALACQACRPLRLPYGRDSAPDK